MPSQYLGEYRMCDLSVSYAAWLLDYRAIATILHAEPVRGTRVPNDTTMLHDRNTARSSQVPVPPTQALERPRVISSYVFETCSQCFHW
jgi:hypothetical protein